MILGGPGSGKTTTLSYAILSLLRHRAHTAFGIRNELVPLFIPLRRVPRTNTALLDDVLNPETEILPNDLARSCPTGFFESRLARGGCVVLLDGLDEVVDETTRPTIAEKINRMVADYLDNRYVVTCRIAGWRDLLADFRLVEAQDFDRDEVHRFVRGWYRAILTQAERGRFEVEIPDTAKREAEWAGLSRRCAPAGHRRPIESSHHRDRER